MTPQEILREAEKTLEQRKRVYGAYENSLRQIARYWSVYFQERRCLPLSGHDVAMLMMLLKIARAQESSSLSDHYIDICGYAALAGGLSGASKD